MDAEEQNQVDALQKRIDSLLKQTPDMQRKTRFADYRPDHTPEIVQKLMQAATPGGTKGVEAALNEFDRLAVKEDIGRMQHALMLFLMHDSAANELGLRIPPLEQRSVWKTLPGKRKQ